MNYPSLKGLVKKYRQKRQQSEDKEGIQMDPLFNSYKVSSLASSRQAYIEACMKWRCLFLRVSNVTVRKRLAIALAIGIVVFFIIDIRLGIVQFYLGDKLTGLAKDYGAGIFLLKPNEEKFSIGMVLSWQRIYLLQQSMSSQDRLRILGRRRNSLLQYWI